MTRIGRERIRLPIRVALCMASVLAASLATQLILPYVQDTRMLLFYVAVVLSAWLGGLWLGVLAIVLSVAVAEYLIVPPLRGYALDAAAVVRALLFSVAALGGTWIIVRLRGALELADASADEARAATRRLEDQASVLETQVAESGELAAALRRVNEQFAASNEQLERSAERTRRLQAVTAALLKPLTPELVTDVVLREGVQSIGADAGLIALAAPDGRTAHVEASVGYPDALIREWRVLSIDAPLPITAAIRTGKSVWVASRAERDTRFPILSAVATANNSWAALPLIARDRTIGVLALSYRGAGEWSDEDRAFLELLARQCAQALERARLHEAERSARLEAEFASRQIGFLADASTRLAASLDRDVALGGLAELIIGEMADVCLIHLLDDSGDLVLALVRARTQETAELLRAMDRGGEGAAPIRPARVVESGRPELEPEVDWTTRLGRDGDGCAEQLKHLDAVSRLAVPIPARDRVIGAVTLLSTGTSRQYGPADLTLVEELGRRAAQAIENARLYATTLAASQAKSNFLAVMSHELRTPLNAILGYADLVTLGVPDAAPPGVLHQIERVRTAAQHLLRLVDEVLSFARIEAGQEQVRLEWTDAVTLAREAVALVQPLAHEKGLDVDLDAPTTPIKIETDVWKVRQILNNLLSNAVKFTAEGGITVSVRREPGSVGLAVADTGIGIADEHRDRIFDPFWQVEQSATRRYGGTGIGLGVALELSRMIGGELTVDSEVGRGSTFTLTLPLRTPRPAHSEFVDRSTTT